MVAAALMGCSSARYGASETGQPSVTLPAHFAEGKPRRDGGPGQQTAQKTNRASDTGGAGDDGTGDAEPADPAEERASRAPPDPSPLSTRRQWEYIFRYSGGQVSVESVRPLLFDKPVTAKRHMGRFAVELWIGRELIERIRFDFPLLGGEEPPPKDAPRPLDAPPRFGPGAEVERRVVVPASERATRAVLVDRATGKATPLSWPPNAPLEDTAAEDSDTGSEVGRSAPLSRDGGMRPGP